VSPIEIFGSQLIGRILVTRQRGQWHETSRRWQREQRGKERHDFLGGPIVIRERLLELGQLRIRRIVGLPAQATLYLFDHWIERAIGVIGRKAKRASGESFFFAWALTVSARAVLPMPFSPPISTA
jgi:hypothetical protein